MSHRDDSRTEQVRIECVDIDAQSTVAVSSTTAPLACGVSADWFADFKRRDKKSYHNS